MIRALYASLALSLATPAAYAADIEVRLLNVGAKGPMVFEPDFVEAGPGDTIVFVPTDPGHDVASIEGMLPDGVEAFKSPFSQEYRLTVESPGLYGVKCTPHYGMGMVALVKVGEASNLAEAEAVTHPGRARQVFEELLAQAGG